MSRDDLDKNCGMHPCPKCESEMFKRTKVNLDKNISIEYLACNCGHEEKVK